MQSSGGADKSMHFAEQAWPSQMWYWSVGLAVYGLSFVLGGAAGFFVGLLSFFGLFKDPLNRGYWLLAIAWSANPAFWVGSHYLSSGKNRIAGIWGASGLLMATCAVGIGFDMVFITSGF